MDFAGLPPREEMYEAVLRKDTAYEGVFFLGVRTTGIFCRPSCPARKPKFDNVEFFGRIADALHAGYRPCLRCRPLEYAGTPPRWLRGLLEELDREPERRWRDGDLRQRGLDPTRVRRWFQKNHGMTFHAYQRARRLGGALGRLRHGEAIMEAALDSGYDSLSGFSEALQKITGCSPDRSRSSLTLQVTRLGTPLGPMIVATSDEKLVLLEFVDRRSIETQLRQACNRLDAVMVPGENRLARAVADQLKDYFDGQLRVFDLPLALAGTPFQEEVWRQLLTIPYGTTRSYLEQAREIGRPQAVRAVARANGDNRIAIIVPCHRVVGSDGKLTGYGGGLWRKKRLLELERGQLGLV
jgi:AraC family transcriptional regulator of adaptative response/methylated-DNA-[protein]-cysteine methyltransferase